MIISAAVLMCSWVPNPLLSLLGIMPDKLGQWTDARDNINSRTAVPMVLWGVSAGIWIMYHNLSGLRPWITAWLIGLLLISIAEAGQFFIPNRFPDFEDICWGAGGTCFGLIVAYLITLIRS